MIYEVRINPISGCQELVSLAGVESSTIGCVWKSTDAYACITDCADCSLGMINNAATQLGYTASASNSSTAIGLGATACCTSTAIGNGACAIGNNEIHIKGGSAEVISKCNCINISNGGSTVIDVSDTALNACSEANIYLNVACDCIDIKGCTAVANVDTNKVSIGASVTGAACSVAIGASASVSAACSTAVGYCASVSCAGGVAIGSTAVSCEYGIALGFGSTAGGCKAVTIGYSSYTGDANTIVVGNDLIADANSCPGDTYIGAGSNVFKFCGATGYTYGNGCMMTGRILGCAAELPATNCSNILFFVS